MSLPLSRQAFHTESLRDAVLPRLGRNPKAWRAIFKLRLCRHRLRCARRGQAAGVGLAHKQVQQLGVVYLRLIPVLISEVSEVEPSRRALRPEDVPERGRTADVERERGQDVEVQLGAG